MLCYVCIYIIFFRIYFYDEMEWYGMGWIQMERNGTD